jgi:glycosyltransferase involved in cell wall biosynthesis
MLCAIPSKGRAGKVKSTKVLPDATLFVPESERSDYSRFHPVVIGVPDEVRGITCTRNWILNNTRDPWVVFLDDDLKDQGFVELRSRSSTRRKLTGAQWLEEFAKLFEMTEELGYRVWGVATQAATRSVYPWSPFLFQSYVTASCMGLLNPPGGGGIRFDESFPVKEDYEICLRAIQEDGGVVAARYLFWENSHWTDPGGCKSYRTQQMEEKAIRDLIRLYPNQIRRVTRNESKYCIQLEF